MKTLSNYLFYWKSVYLKADSTLAWWCWLGFWACMYVYGHVFLTIISLLASLIFHLLPCLLSFPPHSDKGRHVLHTQKGCSPSNSSRFQQRHVLICFFKSEDVLVPHCQKWPHPVQHNKTTFFCYSLQLNPQDLNPQRTNWNSQITHHAYSLMLQRVELN